MVTTSREFITISMDQQREFRERINPGEDVTIPNIKDTYAKRPEEMEDVTLERKNNKKTLKSTNSWRI